MGKNSPNYACTVRGMAELYEQRGELDRALEMYEEARTVYEVGCAHGTGLFVLDVSTGIHHGHEAALLH